MKLITEPPFNKLSSLLFRALDQVASNPGSWRALLQLLLAKSVKRLRRKPRNIASFISAVHATLGLGAGICTKRTVTHKAVKMRQMKTAKRKGNRAKGLDQKLANKILAKKETGVLTISNIFSLAKKDKMIILPQ